MAGLGLRSVFDLRSEPERTAQPDRLPPGAGYVVIDVLEGSPDLSPGRLLRAFAEPRRAAELLGDGGAAALWQGQYRQLVSLGSARAGYGRLFADLLDATRRPALVHCTTGKDRTGWAVAALLLLLDVDPAVVMDDFLCSGRRLAPLLAPAFERFRAVGGDPELLRPIAEARPEYLEAAIAEVEGSFGSIEAYFTDGLGLGPDAQDALRSIFVAREQ